MRDKNLVAVILAAGQGKRLGGQSQKVVRALLGKSILSYLLGTVKKLNPSKIIMVVGHRKEEVFADMRKEEVLYVEQPEPAGTGDAVRRVHPRLKHYQGDVLVLCGDVPFLTLRTLRNLLSQHRRKKTSCTLLTAWMKKPTGYGRIKRNGWGSVVGIVEEVNASAAEKKIKEVNAGVYVFKSQSLFSALRQVRPDPVKGEYYLTDVIEILVNQGQRLSSYLTPTPEETMGINTPDDLRRAEKFLREVKNE